MSGPARKARPVKRRAFTLIELLIVIVIIGVLIGISLPALKSARDRARNTLCMNNSRQIVGATAAFSVSNKGQLPENRTLTGNGIEHVTWRYRFVKEGYIPAGKPWQCPARIEPALSEQGFQDENTNCIGDEASNYALNGHVLWKLNKEAATVSRPEAAIFRPSHTILLAESRAVFPDIRVINYIIAQQDDRGGSFGFWHSGKGTYGFNDGHVESIRFMDTGNPDCRWHNGRDLNDDPVEGVLPENTSQHGHDDWKYLVHPVYLK
ncbi:MAG: prepilin-type N-terminal cleavage/methylation domain-containing protein [Planctomycetes bacterium]|nr:prepilin-type N-terminal cleavage/methylation domain-containing protein [Planctomycetota bacterium]